MDASDNHYISSATQTKKFKNKNAIFTKKFTDRLLFTLKARDFLHVVFLTTSH